MKFSDAFRLVQLHYQVLKRKLSANNTIYLDLLHKHIEGTINMKYLYKKYYNENKYEEVEKR